MRKKKGFTLIELIAVLVILAILALIVTPLVLNIIKKARTAADKRSIDAYGRSIELAIADYLLDKGEFPTSIEQLKIEYTGDEVVCNTAILNSDSSVYLAECTVGGRSVAGYTYGKEQTVTYESYKVGDEVTANGVDYYVIKDSAASESNLLLLKKTPLTVAEVNQYGTGHVNMNVNSSDSWYQTAYDVKSDGTVGGMQYYSSSTCGYNGSWVYDGCTTDYEQSEIKYVVDAWKASKAPAASEARLITVDDLTDNLGMEFSRPNPTTMQVVQTDDTPSWVFGEGYGYWTSTANTDKTSEVWSVDTGGNVGSRIVHYSSTSAACAQL